MAGSDDRGLDLHLPWGRSSPPPGLERSERRGGGEPERPEPGPPPPPDPPPPPPKAAPKPEPSESPDGRAVVDGAAAIRIAEALEGLQFGITARSNRLAKQVATDAAGLAARLEMFEGRLEAAHAASVEAVGLLAGQLMAGLEAQAERVERTLQARHEHLLRHVEEQVERAERTLQARSDDILRHVDQQVARIERGVQAGHAGVAALVDASIATRHDELLGKLAPAQAEMREAVGALASGQLVEKLVEDVVATGEVLDAELIELKRLLSDKRRDWTGRPDREEPAPSRLAEERRLEDADPTL